jgi:hypothetical protein
VPLVTKFSIRPAFSKCWSSPGFLSATASQKVQRYLKKLNWYGSFLLFPEKEAKSVVLLRRNLAGTHASALGQEGLKNISRSEMSLQFSSFSKNEAKHVVLLGRELAGIENSVKPIPGAADVPEERLNDISRSSIGLVAGIVVLVQVHLVEASQR